MSFIRERLQGRLKGWFAKSLSHGGKEILLKSIELALPVYAMSCFKLPKETCAKLTSTMTEFWWSSGNNKKKIPWVAWQNLCKDKEKGGLGFYDLEKFNQAWRIWKSPDSLVAKILKARYFPRAFVLDGCIGRRPSYAWRSIMFGRDLMKQGLVKEIGNGEESRVWLDNWVIDTVPRPPNYRHDSVVDLTLTVDTLIDQQTGSWNVRRVRETIADDDVERVLATKIFRGKDDSLRWGFASNGVYNTKSGYNLLQKMQEFQFPGLNDLPPVEKQLWRSLWKSKTSPKLRHFLWKAMAEALAVKQQLRSRGIHIDPMCSVCGLARESICHMLFQCPRASEVWKLSKLPLPPAGFSNNSVFLNMHYLISCSHKRGLDPKLQLAFPWILWHIWKARNLLCFEKINLSAAEIISKAMDEASMWLTVNVPRIMEISSRSLAANTTEVWRKPPTGFVKCNVGFSWSSNTQLAGASWLVRDSDEVALSHSRRAFPGIHSEHQASLVAFGWAAEAMVDLKIDRVFMEVSSGNIQQILSQPSSYPYLSEWVQKTHNALIRLETCCLCTVPMTCNYVALEIAGSVTRDHR
ncbi:hypothetical protein YC2023_107294 [Brassica napus]